MITIKSEYELSLMRRASRIVYDTHKYIKPYIVPGVTTKELNDLAHDYIISQDAYPSCLGYEGYPASAIFVPNTEADSISFNNVAPTAGEIGIDNNKSLSFA